MCLSPKVPIIIPILARDNKRAPLDRRREQEEMIPETRSHDDYVARVYESVVCALNTWAMVE